jgi:hypothetical protein
MGILRATGQLLQQLAASNLLKLFKSLKVFRISRAVLLPRLKTRSNQ